jgi:type I restriction enzyme R subunit
MPTAPAAPRVTTMSAGPSSSQPAAADTETLSRKWAHADSRRALIARVEEGGIDLPELVEVVGTPGIDPLDALFHLAWDTPVRTRAERAGNARQAHAADLAAMTAQARDILEGLLRRYEDFGLADIETPEVFRLAPLDRLGSPTELAAIAGGPDRLRNTLGLVQEWLFSDGETGQAV